MPKPMKAKTLKLPAETIEAIERIAAKEGIPQYVVMARAIWYYDTLPTRLAESLDSILIPKLGQMVQERNAEFARLLQESENRILSKLSNGKP